uniref:Uncharacterized protein n=1 Tax=Panagrolaimus sp. PS1159 TaxID=55785 RepID=A0AC35F544_9BILA
MIIQYAVIFIFLIFNNHVSSNVDHNFTECCKRTVSNSCAKHCKYYNSLLRYSWPFLKGDCNWEKNVIHFVIVL